MENTEQNTLSDTTNQSAGFNISDGNDKPKEKKLEYFTAITSGELPMNTEDQIRATKGENVPLAPMTDLWSKPEIKKKYQEKFGDKAFDSFSQDYDKASVSFNNFQFLLGGKNSKAAILAGVEKNDTQDVLGVKMSGFSPTLRTIDKTETGALDLFDIHTYATKSQRKDAIDNEGFYDPANNSWREIKKPTYLESVGAWLDGMNNISSASVEKMKADIDPVDNPLYTNKDGKMIKALVYITGDDLKKEMLKRDPNSQHGIDTRGRAYQKAVYYGEEIGGQEVVSTLDFLGITDPQVAAGKGKSLASALPRAIINTGSGVIGGAASSLLALNDLVASGDNDNAFRNYMESIDASMKRSKMSVSEASKLDQFSFENNATGIANVATQLAFGFGASSVVGAGGSLVSLTSMAVETSRDEAIAAGFNAEEAATFQMASIGAMALSNKLFGWVDDRTTAGIFKAKIGALVKDNLAYTAEKAALETTKEGRKQAVLDGSKKLFISIKNAAKSVAEKSGDIGKEAMEESTETLFNHINKQLENLAFKDDDQQGFMSLNDPQFLKSFYSEMGMSAVMGGIGGGMASGAIKLFNKGRNIEDKHNVTNLILSGDGEKYIKFISDLRNQKDGLGSDNLSTEFDNKSQSFKPISEGAISHNEANYRLLLNEFNAITKVIEGIGAKKAYDMVKNDDDFKDSKLAGTAIRDLNNLATEYTTIIASTPNLSEAALDLNLKFESEEKKEEYFDNLAKEYGTTSENIKRLVEIKQNINDINKGFKTEEYIFQNLVKIDAPAKYNENFTGNLFKALKKQQAVREQTSEMLHEVATQSEELVSGIDDQLSNLNSLDGLQLVTEKAKKELVTKFKKAVTDPKDLDYLKRSLSEKYLLRRADGKFLNNDINEEIQFVAENLAEKEAEGNPLVNVQERTQKLVDILSKVHESFYQKSIEGLHTLESLNKFKPLSFMKDPSRSADGSFDFDFSIVNNFLDDNASNVNSMVNALLEENSVDLENNTASSRSVLRLTDGRTLDIFKTVQEKKDKIDHIQTIKDETTIESPNYNFNFIYDEVYGQDDKVNIGASFFSRLHGESSIHNEFKSKEINGVNLFDNISETKELIEQLKLKQSLVKGVVKYHNQLSDYKSSFDKIMSTLNTKETRTVKDILTAINAKNLTSEFMTNFNKVFFDSRTLRVLRNKYKPLIKQHEAELKELNKNLDTEVTNKNEELVATIAGQIKEKVNAHNDEISTLTNLENVKTHLTDISKNISENLEKLNSYLEVAQANQNVENQLSNSINGIANNVKANVKGAYDFLDALNSSVDPKVNGLINREDAEVKEFLNYFNNNFKENLKNDSSLKEDNTALYKFYDYLRNSKDRFSMQTALFVYFNNTFDAKSNNSEFNRLLIASQFNIRNFDVMFDTLTKESPYLAYAEQQEVALTVAAHLNSNVSNLYLSFLRAKDISFKRKIGNIPKDVIVESDINIHSQDVMTLFGTAGSGKSTFGIGLGTTIGLGIKQSGKVYLASNTNPQLSTLHTTAKDFKFEEKILNKSTLPGLINFLESALDGAINKELVDKLGVIVYDEATVPSSNALDKDTQAQTKFDINKVLYLVEQINKTRDKNDHIKIILSGDPNQNGYVEVKTEGGMQIHARNIGVDKSLYFGSKYLNLNVRSKIQAIADIASIIKTGRYHMGEMVGNTANVNKFNSSYGAHGLSGTKLGVQFTGDTDILNDENLLKNIEDNITKNLNFKIGVVGNDIDVNSKKITEKADSGLEALMLKYPNNFEFYTHENVQGQTFDYTVATMDSNTFYDNNSVWNINDIYNGEMYVAKKLATTIERSRYFTLVINKTKRKFNSEESGTLVLADPKLDTEIVGAVKEFLFKTRPDYAETINTKTNPTKTTSTEPIKTGIVDWNTIIEETRDESGLDNLIDKITKQNVMTPELLTAISEKRDTFKPVVIEDIALKIEQILSEPQDKLTPEQIKFLGDNKELVDKLLAARGNPIATNAIISSTLVNNTIEVEEIELVPTNVKEVETNKLAEELKEIDSEASVIQKAMFDDIGLLSAYSKGNVLEGSDEKFTETAMQHLLQNKFDSFNYEFTVVPSTAADGTNVFKPYIKIIKKDGSSFGSLRIFVPAGDSDFLNFIKQSTTNISLTPAQVKSFIDNITSGKVNTGENITLTQLRESLLKKGLSVSDNIYVYTAKTPGDTGNNAGDAFILYSQKDMDLDTDMANKAPSNTTVSFDLKSIDKKVRRFRNSVGVIKLNLKPIEKFSDLYKQYMHIIGSGASNIKGSKFLNSYIAANGPSAKITEFLCLFVEKYNKVDLSSITNKIPEKNRRDLDTGLDNLIKENPDVLKEIADKLQGLVEASIGIEGKLTPKNLFIYAVTDNGKKKCFLNFDLLLNSFGEEELDNLDKIFNVGFSKGIYARFKAIKTGSNANKLFAMLDRDGIEGISEGIKLNLDDSYSVNVDINNPIGTPIIYISNSRLLEALKGKPKVAVTSPTITSTELLINNLNSSDTSSKEYKDIVNIIEELPVNKVSEKKAKANFESLLSKKLIELNKSPMDAMFIKNSVVKVYKSPLMLIDIENNNVDIRGKQYDPSIELDNNELNDFVLRELDKISYSKVNQLEIDKTIAFFNTIKNVLSDATNEKLINKTISLEAEFGEMNIFPTENLNGKNLPKVLSESFKISILNDESRLNNYKLAMSNSNKDLKFLSESFNKTEIEAIKEYLSSIQTCK